MADIGEELGKAAAGLVTEIYKDGAQEGVKQVGSALGTVFEALTGWKYTIMLKNEQRRMIFERNKEKLRESFAQIPEERIVEVPPELSVPILEKLSYTSNEGLANLFINLLSTAADENTVVSAHPAFVEMISRMSADEAKILVYLIGKLNIPYLDLKLITSDEGHFIIPAKYFTAIELKIECSAPNNMNVYIDNLITLGIIENIKDSQLVNEDVYEELESLYEKTMENWTIYVQTIREVKSAKWERGYLLITSFGRLFIEACTRTV